MGRPRKADRRTIAIHCVSIRFSDPGLAALDAAVARTAAAAESRGIHVTRTDFMMDAVVRAIRATGIVIDDPVAPLLNLPGEVEQREPTLPGMGVPLFEPSRRR